MLINLNVLCVGLSCVLKRQKWLMSYKSNLIKAVKNHLMPDNWFMFISITLILESCLKQFQSSYPVI